MALHAVGVVRLRQRRRAAAYRAFVRAIEEAKRNRLRHWVYECQVDASEAAPDRQTAIALLRDARRRAVIAKNREVVLRASLLLAEHHLSASEREAALREFGKASTFASRGERPEVLAARLHLLLDTNNNRRIAAGFRAFRQTAIGTENWRLSVDMHMALGDYLWGKGADESINSYEMYSVAMLKAAVSDLGAALKIGAHILLRLLAVPVEQRDRLFPRLERRVTRWLERQRLPESGLVIAFSYFPARRATSTRFSEKRGESFRQGDSPNAA